MGNFIKYFVQLCAVAAIFWFLKFVLSPESLCTDHSDPKLADNFYECDPGGFTVKKGVWEQKEHEKPVWRKQGKSFILTDVEEVEIKKKTVITKEDLKNDWDCDDRLYSLSDSQLAKINIQDYCKYDPLKGTRKKYKKPVEESQPQTEL